MVALYTTWYNFVRQHKTQRLRWLQQGPGLFGTAPAERQQQCRKPASGLP